MTTTLGSSTPGTESAGTDPVFSDPYPSRSRHRQTWLGLIALVIIAGVVATAAWAINNWRSTAAEIAGVQTFTVTPRDFRVVLKEKGELKAAKSTDIKSEVEGRCTIISLVDEGKAVEKGDLLVELASDQIEERIRQEELKETNEKSI